MVFKYLKSIPFNIHVYPTGASSCSSSSAALGLGMGEGVGGGGGGSGGESVMAAVGTVGSVSVSLHPLVILNISEHWTRQRAQEGRPVQGESQHYSGNHNIMTLRCQRF